MIWNTLASKFASSLYVKTNRPKKKANLLKQAFAKGGFLHFGPICMPLRDTKQCWVLGNHDTSHWCDRSEGWAVSAWSLALSESSLCLLSDLSLPCSERKDVGSKLGRELGLLSDRVCHFITDLLFWVYTLWVQISAHHLSGCDRVGMRDQLCASVSSQGYREDNITKGMAHRVRPGTQWVLTSLRFGFYGYSEPRALGPVTGEDSSVSVDFRAVPIFFSHSLTLAVHHYLPKPRKEFGLWALLMILHVHFHESSSWHLFLSPWTSEIPSLPIFIFILNYAESFQNKLFWFTLIILHM